MILYAPGVENLQSKPARPMTASYIRLDYNLFSKYDGGWGRWTSPDPYGASMNISDPQSFNRYSYVSNDPVNFVDPTGRDETCFKDDQRKEIRVPESEYEHIVTVHVRLSRQRSHKSEPLAPIPATTPFHHRKGDRSCSGWRNGWTSRRSLTPATRNARLPNSPVQTLVDDKDDFRSSL